MIKIGIIFFGLPRSSEITLPSIRKYILNQLNDYEVVIESCLSLQQHISNQRSNEESTLKPENYDFFKNFSHQFIEPSQLLDQQLFHQIIKFGDIWKDNGNSIKNLLLQLKTIQIAYLNCKKNECDYYIFVRPDLIIHEPIPINAFIEKYKNKNAILLPSWQWHRGVNDRFALTSKVSADSYGLRYEKLIEYCSKEKSAIKSETFLMDQLNDAHVQIKTCPSKMSRVRVSGQLKEECFSSIKRMGGFKVAFYAQINQVMFADKIFSLIKIMLYYSFKLLKIQNKY